MEDLIRIHIFRFAGGMFIALYLVDKLPARFALVAGPGDLITAISCYVVAHYVFVKRTSSIKWAYAWNIFGLTRHPAGHLNDRRPQFSGRGFGNRAGSGQHS